MSRLLVLASPRSGTRSVAALLRGAGLRIGHESMLREGSVSSLFVVDDFLYPGVHVGDRPQIHKFETTVHLVRHPLNTIASLASLNKPHFWHWTQVHTKLSYEELGPIEYAARFWVIWNEKIRAQYPNAVWRLEDIREWWPRVAKVFSLRLDTEIPHEGRSEHDSFSWPDLGDAEELVRKEAALYDY